MRMEGIDDVPKPLVVLARLLIALALLAGLLAAAPRPRAVDERFVYETLPPTPKLAAATAFADGDVGHAGRVDCGATPITLRFELPEPPIATYLINLGRNIIPWGSEGTHRFVLRLGDASGPVVYEATDGFGSPRIIDMSGVAWRQARKGYLDLVPTIECEDDGWTYRPDSDWQHWDIEAYHIATQPHRMPKLDSVSVWYENGLDRMEDLKKYDLVIIGDITQDSAPGISELKDAGVTVAGYVSFGEEYRPEPALPIVGDGQGPGGFDSRYVDHEDGDGARVADGFPDFKNSFGGRNYFTNPKSPTWRAEMHELIAEQQAAGTDAIFFDTFGVTHPDELDGIRPLIEGVRDAFGDMKLIVNSYTYYPEVAGIVHAVMFESFTYAHGERHPQEDIEARDRQGAFATLLRTGLEGDVFDVFTLDYVDPVDDDAEVADAQRRAHQHDLVLGIWRMLLVNPAVDLQATEREGRVDLTWRTYDGDPHPEDMSGVSSYEIRKLGRPFVTDQDWEDGTIVEAGLPRGTRAASDLAPPDGPLYYALRAYRDQLGMPLHGTVTVQAR